MAEGCACKVDSSACSLSLPSASAVDPDTARQVQPAKCDSSRSRAQPGGARALRANHKTSGAVRLQPCPSLRWQGGRIRKGKSWIDRDVPPLRTLLRDRVGGVRGMQGGLGEQSQAPLVPLARAVPGSSCYRRTAHDPDRHRSERSGSSFAGNCFLVFSYGRKRMILPSREAF